MHLFNTKQAHRLIPQSRTRPSTSYVQEIKR